MTDEPLESLLARLEELYAVGADAPYFDREIRLTFPRLLRELREARDEVARVTGEPDPARVHRAGAISAALGMEDTSTTKQVAAINALRAENELRAPSPHCPVCGQHWGLHRATPCAT